MKRFLLDTNIYGLILAAKEFHAIHPFIQEKRDFLKLYGFDIVRHELKEAPSTVVRGVNVRAGLLRIYESFICNELALKVYKEVNAKRSISVPAFIGYEVFKNQLRTTLSDPVINNSNKLWIFLGFLNISKGVWFLFHTLLPEKLIYKDFVS